MTDDIVNQLRHITLQDLTPRIYQTMSNAADEIEHLRHQLEQWKQTARLFYLRHDNRRNCSLITSCKECDAYESLIQKEQQ